MLDSWHYGMIAPIIATIGVSVIAFWFSWPLWINTSGAAQFKGHDKQIFWRSK